MVLGALVGIAYVKQESAVSKKAATPELPSESMKGDEFNVDPRLFSLNNPGRMPNSSTKSCGARVE